MEPWLHGVIPAAITPFDGQGRIDEKKPFEGAGILLPGLRRAQGRKGFCKHAE